MNQDRYLMNSVTRTIEVLEAFTRKPSYTNAELSRKTNINKSTLFRILYTLEREGVLRRDQETNRYYLTYKLFHIGQAYVQETDLKTKAAIHLATLADVTGESAHLGIIDHQEVLFLDRVDSSQPIGLHSSIGMKLPAYCTAIGKLLLAFQDETYLEKYMKTITLKAYTPNTITDTNTFLINLQQIRQCGFSIDRAEYQLEVLALAAPIRTGEGRVVGAVSVAGPIFRMDTEEVRRDLVDRVQNAAMRISRELGYVES
jgi:IclR family transcriptional regulator, KDG regulon repressor